MNRNNDIAQTHKNLLKLHDELFNQAKRAESITEFDALSNEMAEVLHRINMLQRLLFVSSTAEITKRAQSVAKADEALKGKIKSFESIKETVQEVTQYLAKVDELIDFAKAAFV